MVKHRSGTRWLGGQVTPCAVCTVHVEKRSANFLVEPQNQGRVSWLTLKTKVDDFFWFDLKTDDYDSCGLASKPLARVFRFGPQNRQLRFGNLAHKITAIVSWFGPQNQVGYGLSVAP
jgi:hypothetical protein